MCIIAIPWPKFFLKEVVGLHDGMRATRLEAIETVLRFSGGPPAVRSAATGY
jgi:hypothetical protein